MGTLYTNGARRHDCRPADWTLETRKGLRFSISKCTWMHTRVGENRVFPGQRLAFQSGRGDLNPRPPRPERPWLQVRYQRVRVQGASYQPFRVAGRFLLTSPGMVRSPLAWDKNGTGFRPPLHSLDRNRFSTRALRRAEVLSRIRSFCRYRCRNEQDACPPGEGPSLETEGDVDPPLVDARRRSSDVARDAPSSSRGHRRRARRR